MARPREFSRDSALREAMEVFWEKGYDGTTMQDLVDRLEIGRASLYAAFGSKRKLFDEALERYCEWIRDGYLAPLRVPGSPLKAIRTFFSGLVDVLCEGDVPSCLLVKMAVLGGASDRETAERVRRATECIEEAFYGMLVRARESGELRVGRSPRALARFLAHSTQGLVVSANVRPDRRVLQDIVRTSLSVLA